MTIETTGTPQGDGTVRLVQRPEKYNAEAVKLLEDALAEAKTGRIVDCVIVGTYVGTNNYATWWTHGDDYARLLGLLTMVKDDVLTRWRTR